MWDDNGKAHIRRKRCHCADALAHVLAAARVGPIPEPAVDDNVHDQGLQPQVINAR
jgi:hypothetical protein